MAQVVISTTDDSTAWDSNNSVTINTTWNLFSANTWMFSSGNMAIINGANTGTWSDGGGPAIVFQSNTGGSSFTLFRANGRFPIGNSFANMPVGEEGMATGVNPDNELWILNAN